MRKGGLKVYTTIDLNLQREARSAMEGVLNESGDPSSAIVTIDPRNGYIRAMASTGSYGANKFNLAAQGHRQPGSTFKILVLMTALRKGVDPNSTTYNSHPLDLNTPYGPWKVNTYSHSYGGNMNLVQATLQSDNTVFAQLDLDVGPDAVRQTAYDMGITTHLDGYPAEGLGGLSLGVSPLEMANAYATIADGGYRNKPIAITQGRVPRRQVRGPRPPEAQEGVLRRRHLRGDEDPRAERAVRHGDARRDRLPRGRQDRHDGRLHRRLVRRLHPAALDLGVGRLPQREGPDDATCTASRSTAAASPRRSGTTTCRRPWATTAPTSRSPRSPSTPQPFFGSYAATGGRRIGRPVDNGYGGGRATTPAAAPANGNGNGGGTGGGGGGSPAAAAATTTRTSTSPRRSPARATCRRRAAEPAAPAPVPARQPGPSATL